MKTKYKDRLKERATRLELRVEELEVKLEFGSKARRQLLNEVLELREMVLEMQKGRNAEEA